MQRFRKSAVQNSVLRLTVSAMMIALSIVLCRLLGFSPPGVPYRVEIGFLPIAFIGMLYGPVWSMLAYTVSDLIGAAIFTGINPFIMLCKTLFGFLLGAFLFTRRARFSTVEFILRSVVCHLVITAFVDIAIMSPIFVFMGYSPNFPVAFLDRTINAAVNLPIRIAVTILFYFPLRELIAKYKAKEIFHL